MPDLIPSGRFAQLARLSRKALRLYAELHLLRPVHVGADNGYWYYSLGQLEDAARISKLRDFGMSLDTIRVVLRAWTTPALKAHLEAHRHTLLAQAAEVAAAMAALESLIESPPQAYPVSCKAVDAQPYLGRRAWTAPADACGFIEQTQARLLRALVAAGIRPTGPTWAVYHDEGEEAWDIEVCVPVGVDQGTSSGTDLIHGERSAGRLAYTVHTGDCGGDQGMAGAYASVWRWVRDHGHQLLGGPVEVYLFDESNTAQVEDYRTEIGWMLQPG